MDIWEINTGDPADQDRADIEYYRALYGASIAYLDTAVAGMIRRIQNRTDRERVFIVTADHGENLAYPHEDYLIEHKSSLSEGVLHVPFLIVGDEVSLEGDYLSLTDLRSVVADIAADEAVDHTIERIHAELVGLGQSQPDVSDEVYWHPATRSEPAAESADRLHHAPTSTCKAESY
jgi:hypothetical protein